MNAYIEFLRSKSGDNFGAFFTGPLATVGNIQSLASEASSAGSGSGGFSSFWKGVNPKNFNPKTAENIKTAEDLLNATSEERNRFEKIALKEVAKKQSTMTNAEQKEFAKKNKKLLKVLKKEGYVPSTGTRQPMEASTSNWLIQSILKVTAGAIVGGVGYHFIGKMRSGSASRYQHRVDGNSIVLIGPQYGSARFPSGSNMTDAEKGIVRSGYSGFYGLVEQANTGDPKAIGLLNYYGVK